MYVCICHAVTETTVQESIEAGACSVDEVTRQCRAGGDCGSCHQHIESMLEEHQEEAAARPGRLAVLHPSRPAHAAA